jgi:hypothetical protein
LYVSVGALILVVVGAGLTVNDALALRGLPPLSVANTVCAPAAVFAPTVKGHKNAPPVKLQVA